jgi:hypothetical protein
MTASTVARTIEQMQTKSVKPVPPRMYGAHSRMNSVSNPNDRNVTSNTAKMMTQTAASLTL